VEVAKALGGSFKLVMLAPKTVREMSHCSEGSEHTRQQLQLNGAAYTDRLSTDIKRTNRLKVSTA